MSSLTTQQLLDSKYVNPNHPEHPDNPNNTNDLYGQCLYSILFKFIEEKTVGEICAILNNDYTPDEVRTSLRYGMQSGQIVEKQVENSEPVYSFA